VSGAGEALSRERAEVAIVIEQLTQGWIVAQQLKFVEHGCSWDKVLQPMIGARPNQLSV
jgi:hypothetical protein